MTIENQNEAVDPAPESEVTAAPDDVNQAPGEQEPPKTFTQEELDKIVAAEKAKAKRQAERRLREELSQQAEQAQRQTAQPPRPDQFQNAEDYAEALAEYKADRKIAEREAQQHQSKVKSGYEDRAEEARAKYHDYDEVAHGDHVRITNEMAAVILESDIGPEVAYHLGKNPDEALRISKLSPLAQAREIGKIEASLSSATHAVKKTSSAPEPIKPVGARSTSPAYDPTDARSAEKMSTAEWIKARNAQIAKRHST